MTQAPVYVLTGAGLCEELSAQLAKARWVRGYVRLRKLAAGARAYIERDAEIATQMDRPRGQNRDLSRATAARAAR